MDRTAVLQKIKQAADTNATELDLSKMELTEIPEEIAQLTNLSTLNLYDNQISVIPDSIAQLTKLSSLDLDNNQISVIPDSIAQLTKLSQLYLYSNQISVIPDSIAQLSKLSTLRLSENQISIIPDSIAQLTNLSQLGLNNNQLSSIPDSIVQLINLSILYLGHNQISTIPDSIAQLSRLEILSFAGNHIYFIPDSIGELINLKSLYLGGIEIQKRWNEKSDSIYLSNKDNLIIDLPDSLNRLVNLQVLDLSFTQIKCIPDSICQLINLKSLNLHGTKLSHISDSIKKLRNLTFLDLSKTKIREIPESLFSLTSLEFLYLGNVQVIRNEKSLITNHLPGKSEITHIPDAIAQLINLKELNISGAQITHLPESIVQLINLKILALQDNPITNVPPEIIRKGWGSSQSDDGDPQAIFSYLNATVKHPLNELKVLLVGEGDVGKTSLLKSLLGKPFDDKELKTPGINIEQLQFPTQSEPVRLNLWDFGGQRVMHNTHQFFLTKRSLYLLVLDNRKNEQQNRIEYWLKLIETYGGDSPVIIIGNCADEHPFDLKQRTLRKKYPQIKQFIATSCKTGKGIPELRQLITDQIDQIPHVRDLLPKEWFAIKNQLEAMQSTTDFISYEKYQDLCQLADIATAQDQKTLIGFLHDLGIILNFQDDLRLQDTNVLNPEWVTSGVYDILNNHDLTVKKRGILKLSDLPNILKQIDRYPEAKRPFLMGLLEKFELCFKLDCNPDRYLISDLLPIDEPDIDQYETTTLHFQYHYEISPSSIISRFIVRNHTMIYKTMLWRSGAVLTQDLAKALVRADDEDTFISIKVQGNRGNALLSTIRADFDKIHRTIPHLAVDEYLVVREFHNGKYTDREVPVDYNYLCDLDRKGTPETALPKLKGTYNLRDLLEGVESYDQRQQDLDDRLDRSYKTRDSRKLNPLAKKEKPGLFKASALILFILAIVAAILAVTTHYIPGLQPASIFIGFLAVAVTIFLLTGNITEGTFSKILGSFFNAATSKLAGKDTETPKLPEDPKE
jgi:internalin A